MQVKIVDIKIGNRYRKDMGDIEGLARSMNDVGLIHPVAIDADYQLIAGERRILAAKMLGWESIEARIIHNGQNMPSGGNMYELEDVGQTCVICGYPFAETHHALPRQYGGKDIPENLIALCPNHHAAVHFLLSLDITMATEEGRARMDSRAKREGAAILARQAFLRECDPKLWGFYREHIVPMINAQVNHAN